MNTKEDSVVEGGIAMAINEPEMKLVSIEVKPSKTPVTVWAHQREDGRVVVCVYNPETDGQTYFTLGESGSKFVVLDHG